MRSGSVVIMPPGFNLLLGIREIFKPVFIQAFISELAIEGLYKSVLSRLPWCNKMQPYIILFRPAQQSPAGKSGPLSVTMILGSVWLSESLSSTRTIRAPEIEVSTSMVGHSRLKSSTTVRERNLLPSLKLSATKSMGQRSPGLDGNANGTCLMCHAGASCGAKAPGGLLLHKCVLLFYG